MAHIARIMNALDSPASVSDWLCERAAKHLAAVVTATMGQPVHVDWEPVQTALNSASLDERAGKTWNQSFRESSGRNFPAPLYLRATEEAIQTTAHSVLAAQGFTPEEIDAQLLDSTFSEVIGQFFSLISRDLTSHCGTEVNCGPGQFSSADSEVERWARLVLRAGSARPASPLASFLLGVTGAFLKLLVPQPLEVMKPATAFDLLLDVELPVSVSFGRSLVPLKDVLKLSTGSVVELNRSISEPVEVIVNNCVIARGEVVVIEGNFGVRIQQVISRQERLRTLN